MSGLGVSLHLVSIDLSGVPVTLGLSSWGSCAVTVPPVPAQGGLSLPGESGLTTKGPFSWTLKIRFGVPPGDRYLIRHPLHLNRKELYETEEKPYFSTRSGGEVFNGI